MDLAQAKQAQWKEEREREQRKKTGERRSATSVGRIWKKQKNLFWAKTAKASSEYSSSYSASMATGKPRVFPKNGDYSETWTPESYDSGLQWLEVRFEAMRKAKKIWVFETCGAGALFKVSDEKGEVLWEQEPENCNHDAMLLEITLPKPRFIDKLKLWVQTDVNGDYNEIDAVALVCVDAPKPKPKKKEKKPQDFEMGRETQL